MTPTERIEQIEKELAELKAQVKQDADPVVLSGEFFGMTQKYIYPVPEKDSGCSYRMYNLAAQFNQDQDRPNVGGAEGMGNNLVIYKVSRHASGRFSVEDTGKVFDPWGEQQAEFKPVGELDLKVGDTIEIKATVGCVDSSSIPVRADGPLDYNWLAESALARKVSP